jgi:hypothetical protein
MTLTGIQYYKGLILHFGNYACETRALLASQKNTSGIKLYLQSYTDLIELMVTEDKTDFEQFLDAQSSRLTLLEDFLILLPKNNGLLPKYIFIWLLQSSNLVMR